jgi:hypothetical protein
MKITTFQVRRALSQGFGYFNDSLDNVIMPWLQEDITVAAKGVSTQMTRMELFEVYNRTICQNVVVSSAIEGVEIELSEFYLFVRYVDTEIRKRFKVVPV